MKTAEFRVTDPLKDKVYTGKILYRHLDQLSGIVRDMMHIGRIPINKVYLTLPDGKTYEWDHAVAGHVYSHTVMSEQEFINHTFRLASVR